MLLIGMVQGALACGGFVLGADYVDQIAASDAQQAILRMVGTDAVRVDYRVHYKGDAESFAWIIPVPGVVSAVSEGDEEIFLALEEKVPYDDIRIVVAHLTRDH